MFLCRTVGPTYYFTYELFSAVYLTGTGTDGLSYSLHLFSSLFLYFFKQIITFGKITAFQPTNL
jgi:hypothetical protein